MCMSHDIPLRDLWRQMIEERDFSHIKQYDSAELVNSLADDDRELLAFLMAMHGEKLLSVDYQQGAYYLERATALAPKSIKIYSLKGSAYAQLTSHAPALESATAAYAAAAALEPQNSSIWYQWGVAAMHLGRLQCDVALLQDADRLLLRAAALRSEDEPFYAPLFWSWGQLWHSLSRLSGEPCDLDKALQYYRQVAEHNINAAPFWNDYANALWEMGGLLKRPEVFNDVVALYRKAIQLNPRYYAAQFNLGICYQRYFELTWKSTLFWSAHEQYTHCRVLNPQHGPLYFSWGRLLLLQGQLRRDTDFLDQACDLLERAQALDPNNPKLNLELAEAYLWCGSVYDDLELLHQAEELALSTVQDNPTNAEAWSLVGYCQAEYGHYFGEECYYRTALEKFSHALTLDRTATKAWYGCASTTLAVGELSGDVELIRLAISHFEQAQEFDGPFLPQFWNEWGVTCMKLAELSNDQTALETAIEKFECAIETDLCISDGEHIDPEWLYNYGCAYDFLGDMTEDHTYYERSIALLQKVLEIDPSYLQACYNLAVAYAHLGEFAADIESLQKACEHFQQLLIADVEDEMAWNEWGLALINLALLLYDEAQPDQGELFFNEAEGKLQHAAALGYNVAFYNLACLFSLKGNYTTAIAHLERAEHSAGLPPIEDVMQDEWLDGLRQTEQFRRLMSHLLGKYGGTAD